MEEENQQQVKQKPKEPQRVTTKDPKKLEAGKRLAEINHKKREKPRREKNKCNWRGLPRGGGGGFTSGVNQYYGIGAILAVGMIGGLGYYIYRSKKGPAIREVNDVSMPHHPPKQPSQTNKFEMD